MHQPPKKIGIFMMCHISWFYLTHKIRKTMFLKCVWHLSGCKMSFCIFVSCSAATQHSNLETHNISAVTHHGTPGSSATATPPSASASSSITSPSNARIMQHLEGIKTVLFKKSQEAGNDQGHFWWLSNNTSLHVCASSLSMFSNAILQLFTKCHYDYHWLG